MASKKYVVVDLETTGHSPYSGDRIIQIAMVVLKDWKIEKTYSSFINPERPIPLFIQELTDITDDEVKEAPIFEDIADDIFSFMEDSIFVAHNVDFDLTFLQAEFSRVGLPEWKGKKIDTVELAKVLFPTSISYKLTDLAADLKISLDHAHRADDDAIACTTLLEKSWEKLLSFPIVTLKYLHKKSFHLRSDLSHLFFDALTVKRKMPQESNYIYYKGFALKSLNVPEKNKVLDVPYPEQDEDKIRLLSKMKHFELRKEQFQMMDEIWKRLNTKEEVVIEASTGIGKTFGYLLPAVFFAKKHHRKVCISTYTSYLLDQLVENELPKMEGILDCSVHVSVLKGMHHYIDLSSFEQFLNMDDLSYDETLTLLQLTVWLLNTDTGDLNELNISGGGQLLLDKIRKTSESLEKNGLDFYHRAIEQSKNADIIITNHAMIIADSVRKEGIFQDIGALIVDEAHQFIQAAISSDELIFSYTKWKYMFGQVGLSENHQLFYDFQKMVFQKQLIPFSMMEQLEKKFQFLVHLFDDAMLEIVNKMRKRNQYLKYQTKQTAFLHELSLNNELFQSFSKTLQSWIDLAQEVAQRFKKEIDELERKQKILLTQWEYWIREFKIKIAEWDAVFNNSEEGFSIWVEVDRRNVPGSIHVFRKPIDVKSKIQKVMNEFRKEGSVVWTSGTLTIPNKQRFIVDQLGVGEDVPIIVYQAPESYYKGARSYIVTDMPDIQSVSQNDYVEAVAYAITRIVKSTEGRSFILFTSKNMLKQTFELIQESELLLDYMIFAQGITSGSRMRLLKLFQKFSHSVLFGTNTFWEGVDIPGKGISTVVVVRLPFSSPEEPTFKAKSMALNLKGHNAFTELALPEAILRFKQGFGRLIRYSNDQGSFIVLDRRIDKKSYGKEFLKVLPNITVQKLPLLDMVLELEHWYNNEDRK